MSQNITVVENEQKLIKRALVLSLITVVYNLAEGIVASVFGSRDGTLALLGFGLDSFVEVLSGAGILHLIWRMQYGNPEKRSNFEVFALRITGVAFYLLAAGLLIGSVINIIKGVHPETTVVGAIVAGISILTMYWLYTKKLETGRAMNSQPVISDAKCTKTCFYLSFILLASSLLYEWLHIPYVDAAGALGIGWYAFKEGREAFEKARTGALGCDDACCD